MKMATITYTAHGTITTATVPALMAREMSADYSAIAYYDCVEETENKRVFRSNVGFLDTEIVFQW